MPNQIIRDETVVYVRLSPRGEGDALTDRQVALGDQFSVAMKAILKMFVEPKGHRSGRDEKITPVRQRKLDRESCHAGHNRGIRATFHVGRGPHFD